MYVNPHNACHPVDPPPEGYDDIHWIALIARGDNCDFSTKVCVMALFETAKYVGKNHSAESVIQLKRCSEFI